ncbi:hypothetical protein PWG14_18510 (plasmid) [Chromobacterium amazonense]|uniref:hypothetical protein n=1 Tax=Chromobacterium amazonense TaxID=1382803 RepID=UPI00237D6539|nr:hypothetical protein [Chromobacterium amazonense]MDE1714500.1 hypothetical protein [Chromobacterium amazonense]
MNLPQWLNASIQPTSETRAKGGESGYTEKWGQKVGTSESLVPQGFQELVPTVPTVPTEKQSPQKRHPPTPAKETAAYQNDTDVANRYAVSGDTRPPLAALPRQRLSVDLLQRVNLICRLERWPSADRAEWLGMLRAQIERDGVPPAMLVSTLDSHLARHHAGVDADDDREAIEERAAIMQHDGGWPRAEAERRASQANDCMSCRHWQGEATVPDARQRVAQMVGLPTPHKGNQSIGICGARYRPWRISNLASEADYTHWHFIGQCACQPARAQERAA